MDTTWTEHRHLQVIQGAFMSDFACRSAQIPITWARQGLTVAYKKAQDALSVDFGSKTIIGRNDNDRRVKERHSSPRNTQPWRRDFSQTENDRDGRRRKRTMTTRMRRIESAFCRSAHKNKVEPGTYSARLIVGSQPYLE